MLSNKKKIFILFNLIGWLFLGIIFFYGVMPETPIHVDKNLKKQITIIFPNRWIFFTKDPTEDYIYVLKKTPKGYVFHENFPNSSVSNFFGIVSYQKAVGLEYGIISNQIDDNLWSKNNTGKSLFNFINDDSIKVLELKRTKEMTTLIGEFVFVRIEPVPYLWRNKIRPFEMPSKFVKIKIK